MNVLATVSSKLDSIVPCCPICLLSYDSAKVKPKWVGCGGGHTICVTCLADLILYRKSISGLANPSYTCPCCNLGFSCKSADSLITNIDIIRMVDDIEQLIKTFAPTSSEIICSSCSASIDEKKAYICMSCSAKCGPKCNPRSETFDLQTLCKQVCCSDCVLKSHRSARHGIVSYSMLTKVIRFKPINVAYCCKLMDQLNLPKTGDRMIENIGAVIPAIQAPRSFPLSGDEDCLFRTLSWYLCAGDATYYDVVRERMCAFMNAFKSRFVGLLTENETIDEYIELMRNNGRGIFSSFPRGTSIEIFAAATLLRMPIYSFLGNHWKLYHPCFEYSGSVSNNDMIFVRDLNTPDAKLEENGAIYITNPWSVHFEPVIGTRNSKRTAAQHLDGVDGIVVRKSTFDLAPTSAEIADVL